MTTIGTPPLWAGFVVLVLVMLAVDLALHPTDRPLSAREAAGWTAAWVTVGLSFGAVIFWIGGHLAGMEYLTGYMVEQALSVDNLFVFLVILGFFRVSDHLRHRVLFWGIVGAMALRAIFILAGVALVQRFEWVMYVFGAILFYAGVKLLVGSDETVDPARSLVVRLVRRVVPMTDGFREGRFAVREKGRLLATPLLMVLVMIEVTDLVFAFDSIPAIFGITRDPYIVFTSNILAVAGLRAMLGVIEGVLDRLRFLEHGIGVLLLLVAVKMVLHEVWEPPTWVSLAVIGGVLGVSVLVSVALARRGERAGAAKGDGEGGGAGDGAG